MVFLEALRKLAVSLCLIGLVSACERHDPVIIPDQSTTLPDTIGPFELYAGYGNTFLNFDDKLLKAPEYQLTVRQPRLGTVKLQYYPYYNRAFPTYFLPASYKRDSTAPDRPFVNYDTIPFQLDWRGTDGTARISKGIYIVLALKPL